MKIPMYAYIYITWSEKAKIHISLFENSEHVTDVYDQKLFFQAISNFGTRNPYLPATSYNIRFDLVIRSVLYLSRIGHAKYNIHYSYSMLQIFHAPVYA